MSTPSSHMSTPRILTIMGSGETAPTMVSVHRSVVARLPDPVRAAVLDTPYGFQENAPELAQRAVNYFRTSVNIDIAIAGLTRLHGGTTTPDPVAVERGLRTIAEADYVFAGPGSPTYALHQWKGSTVPALLADKLREGGAITFASAAALTLGSHTVPVYEIYKVGEDPRWEEGLDLLSVIGVRATVIPHYDNAEGGHHDSRFCYLGESRLRYLEDRLPEDVWVLGVDEHTGLVIDIDADQATVVGNGTVSIRLRNGSHVFPSDATIPLDVLREPERELGGTGSRPGTGAGHDDVASAATASAGSMGADRPGRTSLDDELSEHETQFRRAIDEGDATAAVRAALDLEHAIHAWSADTLQSDVADRARAALRSMISALGDAAIDGLRDPRDVIGPLVEALLSIRATVRAEKRYDLSDVIRDIFAARGIEVRDTPDGVEWHLVTPD